MWWLVQQKLKAILLTCNGDAVVKVIFGVQDLLQESAGLLASLNEDDTFVADLDQDLDINMFAFDRLAGNGNGNGNGGADALAKKHQ